MEHPDWEYPEHPLTDEVQYAVQDSEQPAAEDEFDTSLLDPRLYGGSLPNPLQYSDQPAVEDEYYAEEYQAGDDSEEEYELSGDEDSEDEESPDMVEEVADYDDEYGSRRRRRRGTGRFSGRYGARGGKGIKRGPRRPLEPSTEFKMLHSEATSAFIDGDYERAAELVKRAIQINPEMFAAHSLLSEIFLAQGEKDKALTALFSGAHTRPRDPSVWAKVARMVLERAGDDRQTALNDALYCYSRVVDIDQGNLNARFQRAALYRELGHNGRAATDYERALKDSPHNVRALRHLAETYIDLNNVQTAFDYWSESVEYYMTVDPDEAPDFSWSDVNIYAELFTYLGRYDEGLKEIKSLCRWLLGRGDDTMWEDFHADDREWDSNDSPRRIKTDGYIPKQWPRDSYGLGLPIELRIKLGLFRLRMGYEHKDEALHHFEWLNPEDNAEGARLYDYGDLFREVADALKEVTLFEEALRFYTPLQHTGEYADVSFFMAMGDCYMRLGNLEDAENCYITVAEHDTRNVDSRAQLAKLYESIGMTEQALKYVNETVLLERQEMRSNRRRKDTRLEQLAKEFKAAEMAPEEAPVPKEYEEETPEAEGVAATLTAAPISRKQDEGEVEGDRTEHVQYLYSKMQVFHPLVKEGNLEATEDWLDIADALLREFRSNRVFYPLQRQVFMGYSREAQKKAGKSQSRTLMDEMAEMAGRLQESLGNVPVEPLQDAIPTDYHGISFDDWLDMFLQYALLVAEQGEPEEAYEALGAAADASVWYNSKPKTRLIHVCWFTCALRVQDEETLANEARWFIKEYQFVTDTYRLFSMLSHLSGDPHRSLFHSSPNMKFMLRQIKAIDYTLPDNNPQVRQGKAVRESVYQERASLTTRDESGEAIPAEEMDVALLVLYGHILYSGNSFFPALNYFFRAYALDDENPATLLSIALCYIHHSLKRQSENRHYLIMQGLAFMHEYRRVREREGSLQQMQEMEFNFARVWHMLGLAHLAVEGYHRVLELGEQIQYAYRKAVEAAKGGDMVMQDAAAGVGAVATNTQFVEDFSREAAVALQIIYSLSGDFESAKDVTAKWLVI